MSSRQSGATRDPKNEKRDISHPVDMTKTLSFSGLGKHLYDYLVETAKDITTGQDTTNSFIAFQSKLHNSLRYRKDTD